MALIKNKCYVHVNIGSMNVAIIKKDTPPSTIPHFISALMVRSPPGTLSHVIY